MASNPEERAQVVAAWILLEKTSAAIFGAPLVGFLTRRMINDDLVAAAATSDEDKARALSLNLCALSTLFWGLCAIFWLYMGRELRVKPKTDDERFINQEHAGRDLQLPQSWQDGWDKQQWSSKRTESDAAHWKKQPSVFVRGADGPLCRKV